MYVRELSIYGKAARVVVENRRSVVIECDGFRASVRELQFLSLQRKGKSAKEIARLLGVKPRYVSNALQHLRSVNGSTSDNIHHESVARKAEALELTHPLAIQGLLSILAQRNIAYKKKPYVI